MKRIFLCIDGTSNAAEVDPGRPTPSNVLVFARALRGVDLDGDAQVIGYMRGVGTDDSAGVLRRWAAQATGNGFSQLILEAYEFLANNYSLGDQVYLLGFSRGAAAARSLSGFTELFGLLPNRCRAFLPQAWEYYNTHPQQRHLNQLRRVSEEFATIAEEGVALLLGHTRETAEDMRAGVAQSPDNPDPRAHGFLDRVRERTLAAAEEGRAVYVPLYLHFVGVWDTVFHVDSQGYHEGRLAWNVGMARQALAIHEVRSDFPPALWTEKCRHQDVKQVWFPGAHSDVGGGNGNEPRSSLALDWMVQQVLGHSRGRADFDCRFLKDHATRNVAAPLSSPQDDLLWTFRRRERRTIGGPFQFRSRHADDWTMTHPAYDWRNRDLLARADAIAARLPHE